MIDLLSFPNSDSGATYLRNAERQELIARLRTDGELINKLPKCKDTGKPFIPGVDDVCVTGTDGKVYMTNEADIDDDGWYVMYTESGMPTMMTTRDFYCTISAAKAAARKEQ